MRFIFKFVFWGFIALMILPSVVDVPDSNVIEQRDQVSDASSAPHDNFSSLDAMHVAVGVAGYLKNICSNDAELCENGSRLAESAVARAKQGALVVASMVESHRSEMRQTNDPTTTASIK